MTAHPVRYRSGDEDSARWLDFEFRDGDIVISTRSKHGTTWMQMICALLVFGSPDLPRPLGELSPWLDWLVVPEHEVFAELATQTHRRFVKTHTPLDGLPLDDRAFFVVVARHPLDAAVSLHHQSSNLDRQRIADLTGDRAPLARRELAPLPDWLRGWTESDAEAATDLDSFNGVFHHLTDAWRRRDERNVILVHYQDLLDDLGGEMRRIADAVGIAIDDALVDRLEPAASFASMRANSELLAPDRSGVLKDRSAFFRTGRSGAGAAVLTPDEAAAYYSRAARSAPAALLDWLHRN